MPNAIGHVDFYPNGGHTNPGCDKPMQHYILSTGSVSVGFQQFFSCNHVCGLLIQKNYKRDLQVNVEIYSWFVFKFKGSEPRIFPRKH